MTDKTPILNWNSQKWESKNKLMYEKVGRNVWPWFNEELDPDICEVLDRYNLTSGHALDIGTCSGHQAISLAKRGFNVIGTEVSETALEDARKNIALLKDNMPISLLIDDIANSQLESEKFDIVLDRGCFHSICLFAADDYVYHLKRVLKKQGIVIIKTMSHHETRFVQYDKIGSKTLPMPYHFKRAELENFFGRHFSSCDVKESFFHSKNVTPPARAWLTVLRLVDN